MLEGGAIDGDGNGLAVTTEQCLLNPNRNPRMPQSEIEARLHADLGLDRVLWLGDGLLHDHTAGHVDNLARFVAPNRLAILEPCENDPNWRVYQDAVLRAEDFGVEVVRIPSPGRVLGEDEEIIPASYVNFEQHAYENWRPQRSLEKRYTNDRFWVLVHDKKGIAQLACWGVSVLATCRRTISLTPPNTICEA